MAGHHKDTVANLYRQRPHKVKLERLWEGSVHECYNATILLPDATGNPNLFEGVATTAGAALDDLLTQLVENGYGGQKFFIGGTFLAQTATENKVEMEDLDDG
ncbi:hypothetical protein [Shimia thalassica]|uniref:hypothetical protein n=1 Tax=Shimia thalassica TaxID=1715693 RepID=UPI0026E1BF54|nr:hypothetical protein [Shimia thalassica]MDO6479126.1 hypothetical protein [Shimia thalassica]